VENRAGANGGIGTDFVAKSRPMATPAGHRERPFTVNPTLYRSVPYDPIKDFAPISECASINTC